MHREYLVKIWVNQQAYEHASRWNTFEVWLGSYPLIQGHPRIRIRNFILDVIYLECNLINRIHKGPKLNGLITESAMSTVDPTGQRPIAYSKSTIVIIIILFTFLISNNAAVDKKIINLTKRQFQTLK